MSQKLFLDALIGRDDFDVQDSSIVSQGPHKTTLSYNDFEIPGFFFSSLRKPDFQRETNEWDAEKVKDLIESFLDGDLVPAIILWKYADSYTFVIDGAHRISAIASWVNDDYGDGKISRKYFDNAIPEQQLETAKKARELINNTIGSYEDYKKSLFDSDYAPDRIKKRLKNFGTRALQLQWVDGDSKKAENSFFKINQKSTPISDTEIAILKTRRKPAGICSRAILRGGQGYKYWDVFQQEYSKKIKEEAGRINELIFSPILYTPIKTLDLPLGGKNHAASSLSMIYDLVSLLKIDDVNDDITGEKTANSLIKIRKVLQRINDNHVSSLGFHPAVYIYSGSGNFRVSCFQALIGFSEYLRNKNLTDEFIKNRATFELLFLNFESLISQIVRKARQVNKAIEPLIQFMGLLLELLKTGTKQEDIVGIIVTHPLFNYLKVDGPNLQEYGPNFSKETKSQTFLSEAIASCPKCKICGGLLHIKSITFDHIQRKEDGGTGAPNNAQMAHPYCNSTFKN